MTVTAMKIVCDLCGQVQKIMCTSADSGVLDVVVRHPLGLRCGASLVTPISEQGAER